MEVESSQRIDEQNMVTVLKEGESDGILRIRMKVSSEKAAYDLYKQYALNKGLSIRKGRIRWTKNEPIWQREFLCNKSGFHEFDNILEVRKFSHLETRIGCKARIRFIIKNWLWSISHFNDDHNNYSKKIFFFHICLCCNF